MGVKKRSGDYIKFFAYLVVVVLINMAATTLFFRWDLTKNKVFSISEASQHVVSTLCEPLTIDVFFTSNLPAPYNNVEQYLRDLLKEYSIYANRYFNYRFFDVSAEEGAVDREAKKNQELANSYGIYPVQIQTVEKDEIKFQKAYMGLVMIHGDIMERLPTITATNGLEYQLTTGIRKLNNKVGALLRLPGKIRIRLFLSSSLKEVAPLMRLDRLPGLPGDLEKIVEGLNKKSFGKLEFEYLDPTADPGLKRESEKYNIMRLKWPALSGGKIQPGSGSIGLVMEYGERVVEIPLINVLRLPLIGTQYRMVNLNKMDEIINENLESLIDINQDLGYLADHGTLRPAKPSPMDPMGRSGGPLSNFRGLVSQNYTLKEFNLKGGALPEGFNCLVIARPTKAFTDYELFQIDQFLMRGKSLALFLDAFEEVMPPQNMPRQYGQGPQYVPLDTGLSKLLEHYGIRIKKAYVLDESCFKQALPRQFGGGARSIYFAPLIKSRFINKDLGFMQNIKGLVAFKISPLELDEKKIKENGLDAYRLFSSSDRSWEMSGRINLNPLFITPPQSKDKMKSHPLAYILSGEFPSYFAGKPIPQREVEEEGKKKKDDKTEGEARPQPEKKPNSDLSKIKGEGQIITKGKPGKIFLVASSEMLKDSLVDERGETPNATFLMNTLDFLNDREEIAVMRGKEQRFNPLRETRPGTRTFVKTFNIAVLPVVVVLFGLLVWFLRHSRKRRIQMMFER